MCTAPRAPDRCRRTVQAPLEARNQLRTRLLSVVKRVPLPRACRGGKLPRKVGCIPEHCLLCFPCYLQRPPLSTGREIKRVFIRAQAPLDTALQPEPSQTHWLIELAAPTLAPTEPRRLDPQNTGRR